MGIFVFPLRWGGFEFYISCRFLSSDERKAFLRCPLNRKDPLSGSFLLLLTGMFVIFLFHVHSLTPPLSCKGNHTSFYYFLPHSSTIDLLSEVFLVSYQKVTFSIFLLLPFKSIISPSFDLLTSSENSMSFVSPSAK